MRKLRAWFWLKAFRAIPWQWTLLDRGFRLKIWVYVAQHFMDS